MPPRALTAPPLERIEKLSTFFVAAVTFALAAHAYLGMHSVGGSDTLLSASFPIAYAVAVGAAVFLFWRVTLRIAAGRDIQVRHRLLTMAVFLGLIAPAGIWPAATGIAGSNALTVGMNRALNQSLDQLDDRYRQVLAISALAPDLREAAYRQPDTPNRTALARLHEWVLAHRMTATETHATARKAAERMREIANAASAPAKSVAEFASLNEQIVSAAYALTDIYPAAVVSDVSTELARMARQTSPVDETMSDLSTAFGRLADQTARLPVVHTMTPPSPMHVVVEEWRSFIFAWVAATALALLPLVTVVGIAGARTLAPSPAPVMPVARSRRGSFAYQSLLVVAIGIVCLAIVDRTGPIIEAARPTATLSPIHDASPRPEPNIRRYDPSDGAQATIPELGRSVTEWEMANPMVFSHHGGTIVAVGKITERTPGEFLDLAGSMADATTLVLNSPGGSVDGAIALGRLVRETGLRTAVPAGGYCASACPLVFAAGVDRSAGEQAVIGIHQVYAPDTSNPTPELLALSIAEVQKTVARVQEYLTDMDVDPAIWMNALVTGAGELYVLSDAEMRASSLTTQRPSSGNENES